MQKIAIECIAQPEPTPICAYYLLCIAVRASCMNLKLLRFFSRRPAERERDVKCVYNALPSGVAHTVAAHISYLRERPQTGKHYGFVENSMTVCDCVSKMP
jgi:hypothetical protein